MKKLLNSNVLSLLIVKVIFFSASVIIFYAYNNQNNIEELKGLTIQSKEEYIANYDKYLEDIESEKTNLEKEIQNYKKPFVTISVLLIFIAGYMLYQIIQLLVSVYIWDKVRFMMGIKYQRNPRQSEDEILDNISV